MEAKITDITEKEDTIAVTVEFTDGKKTSAKTYNYTRANLESKQQVLDMIQTEVNTFDGFKQIVEDLKEEINVPIEATQAESISE